MGKTTILWAAPLALSAALAGCGGDETAFAGGSLQRAVIFNSENWQHVAYFEGQSNMHTAALYARAVARVNIGKMRCSGVLISDDVLVTARHCREHNDDVDVDVATAFFGQYGPKAGDWAAAREEGRRRLGALGLPQTAIEALSVNDFTKWSCNFIAYDSDKRDVAYFRCPYKMLTWYEWGGGWQEYMGFPLSPGHVWGHVNIARGKRGEDASIYAMSANRRCGESKVNVLISPGKVRDEDADCVGEYRHCASVSTDWVSGSSGGVLMDADDHRAFGLVSGSSTPALVDDAISDNPCIRTSRARVKNLASYIGTRADDYLAQPNLSELGAWRGATGVLGEALGTRRTFECPSGTLAAGVVGTTADSTAVGNFGLVCLRKAPVYRLYFDKGTVIAGGSADVDGHIANNDDLNTTLHEVRSDNQPLQMQSLLMCPPAYYINAITGRSSTLVDAVYSLRCKNPETGHQVTRSAIYGNQQIGGRNAGTVETVMCSSSSFIAGLTSYVGTGTNGFYGRCRYAR